jgi:hypothetical protein
MKSPRPIPGFQIEGWGDSKVLFEIFCDLAPPSCQTVGLRVDGLGVCMAHHHPDHNIEYGPLLVLGWIGGMRQ